MSPHKEKGGLVYKLATAIGVVGIGSIFAAFTWSADIIRAPARVDALETSMIGMQSNIMSERNTREMHEENFTDRLGNIEATQHDMLQTEKEIQQSLYRMEGKMGTLSPKAKEEQNESR